MPVEPPEKRAIAFIDGQNLYFAVKESFGYPYPNYDVLRLSQAVCAAHGWHLKETRFYTGVPDASDDPLWNAFWTAKLAQMGRKGVQTFFRRLRYRNRTVKLPSGATHTILAGEEKGIDVRIALDVISLAHRRNYDVAVVFSQDQDLSEVAEEVRAIAQEQNRWIKVACAFPSALQLEIGVASTRQTGSRLSAPYTTLAWIPVITGPRRFPVREAIVETAASSHRGVAAGGRDRCRVYP